MSVQKLVSRNIKKIIRNRKGEFVIQRKGFNVFIATILCLSMLLFSPEQVEAKSNVNNEESISLVRRYKRDCGTLLRR